MNKATAKKLLDIIQQFMPKQSKPYSIITEHRTQFKGKKWRETLLERGIKTATYHPSSNVAEKVLQEVGRILRTYCYNQH